MQAQYKNITFTYRCFRQNYIYVVRNINAVHLKNFIMSNKNHDSYCEVNKLFFLIKWQQVQKP